MTKNQADENKSRITVARFKQRLTLLKQAQEYSRQDQIHNAVQTYLSYLSTLSDYYGVPQEKLKPSLFDQEKDLTEMLLISQVYWDLAKAYDRNPKLKAETEHCLKQFVSFTIGYKYQYLNYDLLRKFINKKIAYNPHLFIAAMKEIRVHSKRCYVATYCFSSEDRVTNNLRYFKGRLLSYTLGAEFVDLYYSYSPRLISFLEKHPVVSLLFVALTSPLLKVLSFFVERVIEQKKR